MSDLQLKNLLGSDLLALLLPTQYSGRVSSGLEKQNGSIQGNTDFSLLGQTLTVDSELSGSVEIHGKDQPVVVGEHPYMPTKGQYFSDLVINGKAEISGEASSSLTNGISLGLTASAGGDVTYRHLRSAKGTVTKLNALKKLVATSRLPILLKPRNLDTGELQSLASHMEVDLGLTAEYGYTKDLEYDLFGDNNAPITASIKAAINASFGLALTGEFDFTLESCTTQETENENWVRARLERKRKSTLSLAAKLDIEVAYDLGSGLVGLLNELLGTQPAQQLFDTIDNIGEDLRTFSTTDWEALVKEKLTARSQTILDNYLGDGVDDLVNAFGSSNVRKLLVNTQRALTYYRSMDSKIKDLWNRVLGYAHVGPGTKLYSALVVISKLDPNDLDSSLDDLLEHQGLQAIQLVEAITGESIEELIVGADPHVANFLEEAVNAAKSILKFIHNTDINVIKSLNAFTKKTGVEGAVNWLETNLGGVETVADLKEKLIGDANILIQEGVEKLINKAWDKIPQSLLDELKDLATKLADYIGNIDEEKQQLKEKLENMKGDVGMNLGLEWDRVLERTAVVDVSFDPKDRKVLAAYNRLVKGDVHGFLSALPDEDDDDDADYMLNQCLLTDTRTSTLAFNFSISALRGVKTKNRRQVSSSISVVQDANGWHRVGEYVGAYTRIIQEEKQTWQASATASASAYANDKELDQAYTDIIWDLTVSTSRNDTNTSSSELEATLDMLERLGFSDAREEINVANVPDGTTTRLAVKLELGGSTLKTILGAEKNQRALAFLNAGYFWHDTVLASRVGGKPVGPYLAAVIKSNAYLQSWHDPRLLKRLNIDSPSARAQGMGLKTVAAWPSLMAIPTAYGMSENEEEDTVESLDKATEDQTHDNLRSVMNDFSAFAKAATAKAAWTSPMYALYLPLCLLANTDPDLLDDVHGTATFRWKKNDDWQTPVVLGFTSDLHLTQPIAGPN